MMDHLTLQQLAMTRRELLRQHSNEPAEEERILDRVIAVEHLINATPATSAQDLLVKVEILEAELALHIGAEKPDDIERMMLSIIDDIRNMACPSPLSDRRS